MGTDICGIVVGWQYPQVVQRCHTKKNRKPEDWQFYLPDPENKVVGSRVLLICP